MSVYRGSLQDVLERLYSAASFYKFDTVVRLTADCPLTEPSLIDEAIREFYKRDLDYLSNCRPPTFPDGLDVEVMRLEALKVASNKATLPSHREHVTPYIKNNSTFVKKKLFFQPKIMVLQIKKLQKLKINLKKKLENLDIRIILNLYLDW